MRVAIFAQGVGVLAGIVLGAGCSSDSGSSGAALTAADFARADQPNGAISAAPANPAPANPALAVSLPAAPLRPPTAADITGPVEASGGILDVTGTVGAPATTAGPTGPAPLAVSRPALVDAKVGDINGKPLYANAFLAPMADRLRAEAKLKKIENWRADAKKSIEEEVQRVVERELLRAEAMAAFTPEQKQGFFAFMQSVQQKVQSQNLGSREAASQRLEETEGKSLDEYMKQREQDELVTFQLNEKIKRRVTVSKRDVEVFYQQYYDMFNPPPKATYRLVLIPKANQADIDEFTAALAAGKPFAELAASKINTYKRDVGGLEEREIKGDRAAAKLFAAPDINKQAQTMQVGQTAGPFPLGDSSAWLNLESIEKKTKTLYESQVAIENILRNQRERQIKDKYIAQLRARASMTSTGDMSRRLLEIAEERYYVGR